MKWLKGQFAILQSQIVEIIRVIDRPGSVYATPQLQVKLINDSLLHWVRSEDLQELTHQIAPKVLYATRPS